MGVDYRLKTLCQHSIHPLHTHRWDSLAMAVNHNLNILPHPYNDDETQQMTAFPPTIITGWE